MATPGARSMVTSIVMFLACTAGIMGRAAASQTAPGNFEESFTYDFIVNVVNSDAAIGPAPYYVKLDGVLPSVDQFTVHVAPDRMPCRALTGGSCVADLAGFIDGDELTQSNWNKGSTTAGTLLFSISTTVRVSEIEIAYHRPKYGPGWLIEENGVEVYRDIENRGPGETLYVAYTSKLHTLPVDISSQVPVEVKFTGAVLANNGKVIFAPSDADVVGVFDPCDGTFETVDVGAKVTGIRKFSAAALAKDGRVIFAPSHANGVGVFDPTDNSFEVVDISLTSQWKFIGAATANNGKVILAPLNAGGVGVFDPSDDSFELVGISSALGDWVFGGAAAAKNGLIIFPPMACQSGCHRNVGLFNPMDNSFELVDFSATLPTGGAFNEAVVASNGEVIFAPRDADVVGVFNPVTKVLRLVNTGLTGPVKFTGAALANDGKVIFAPTNADAVGIFDPSDDSFELASISTQVGSGGANLFGAVLASNGNVVFSPSTSQYVGIFNPSRSPPTPCCLIPDPKPANGGAGDCTAVLMDGETCQPECDDPYVPSGATTCDGGELVAATCLGSCDMEKCCYDFNVKNQMTVPANCAVLADDWVHLLPPPPPPPKPLGAFRSVTIPASTTTTTRMSEYYKYHTAVKAPNKNVVYFVPHNADVIGKFDVESETYSELTFSALAGAKNHYNGGTLVGSKIYMSPQHRNHFGVFDTVTEQYSTIQVYSSSNPQNMVIGPAALIGTKLYACPNAAGDDMAVIDTTTDTLEEMIALGAVPNHLGFRFMGSYAVGDKVICTPIGRFDTGIGIYDTTARTWTRRDITDVVPDQASNGEYMYYGGCAAGDVVYFNGHFRAGIGKYNVTADDFHEIALDQPARAYLGCAVLDGKAYFAPKAGRKILVLDVATDSYQLVDLTAAMIENVQEVEWYYETFGEPAMAGDKLILPPRGVDVVGILERQP